MKGFKRFASILLSLVLLLQVYSPALVKAAVSNPERPTIIVDGDLKPVTGYSKEDRYFVKLNWKPVNKPAEWDAVYYNLYVQEVDRHGKAGGFVLKERDITATSALLRDLKSGTVYNFYITAYFKRTENNVTYVSEPSAPSNIVNVMTDLQLFAYPFGSKQIKIEWDDVWNTGARIGYRLYIADDSAFSNTQPIYISPAMIGQDSRITVNQATGKLEYVHTVGDAGRVYYVKIEPEISGDDVFYNPKSRTVATSSFILVKTTKLSTSDSGTVWRLDWSEVAVSFQDIKITYQLYKVNSKTNNLPQYMLSVDDNSTYITVPPDETDSYYIIRALVTDPLGNDIYKDWGVKIESDRVYLREMEVPTTPASPELVDKLESAGTTVITYEGELKPDRATLLWKAPRKGNGDIDSDILYDMWLITDPQKIDHPDESSKIAENVKVSDTLVYSGTEIVGCKYVINVLAPNSTYYFKIVAKKTYLEYVNDDLESVTNSSVPALRVVITPPEGSVETPVAPGRPPLKVKKDQNQKELVTDTTATIQLKNKWYEQFLDGKWKYIEPQATVQNGVIIYHPNDQTVKDDVYGTTYRKVEYGNDITIDVGCIEFKEGMNYNELMNSSKYPANKMTGVPVTANDPDENPTANPDGKKHNVDIKIEDLKPNTTYIIWVRANRADAGLLSGPSDPIVITTAPGIGVPPEKPIVPFFNYSYAADVYVELGWEFKTEYKYNIKYSTTEDLSKAQGSAQVTGAELAANNIYKIEGLKPDTQYYFWIQAEVANGQSSITSDWSDAYGIKTKADIPPATPRGFGIKNTADAVTKNSITYEWMREEGLQYILEIASDIDYKDARRIEAGSVSELVVDGLRSNTRYYARLYAYDPQKKLRSLPTQSVIAKTLKSKDDYDSDEDAGHPISGEYIIKDATAPNYTWNVKIIGINADRLIEAIRTDRDVQYLLDLSNPPANTKTLVLTLSSKIFRTLAQLQETLVIATHTGKFTVRPGAFSTALDTTLLNRLGDFNYQISITSPEEGTDSRAKYLTYKTPVMSLRVSALDGSNKVAVEEFKMPLTYAYTYTTGAWYREGITSGYVLDPLKKSWSRVSTTGSYDAERETGRLQFEIQKPGSFAVAEQNAKYFDDIAGHWAENSINHVVSARELKSISGRTFRPDSSATVGDTVKLMLDVLGYGYDSQYMTVAAKSGLIASSDVSNPGSYCSREKAIAMAVRLYEIKSGEKAEPTYGSPVVFQDINQVSSTFAQKVRFAVENGIAIGRTSTVLGPKDNITRAELLVLLEKYLAMTGELD